MDRSLMVSTPRGQPKDWFLPASLLHPHSVNKLAAPKTKLLSVHLIIRICNDLWRNVNHVQVGLPIAASKARILKEAFSWNRRT
jgi:hypothetical protein